MELIARVVLLSLFKIVSPASISSTVIPLKNEDLKTNTSITKMTPSTSPTTVIPLKNEEQKGYQVTENIKDIPDDRILAPIVPNFGLVTALNLGNNSIAFNNNNNNLEQNGNNVVGVNNNKTSDNNGNLKKNSFSILHIKAEFDDKPVTEHQNVFNKVFGGIKSYVYHLKRGVVDGLHSFFHHDDKPEKNQKPEEIVNSFHDKHPYHNRYDKFHRSFDGDENFGEHEHDYYEDEEPREHFSHY